MSGMPIRNVQRATFNSQLLKGVTERAHGGREWGQTRHSADRAFDPAELPKRRSDGRGRLRHPDMGTDTMSDIPIRNVQRETFNSQLSTGLPKWRMVDGIRVEPAVSHRLPHRPVRAVFPHTVPPVTGSHRRRCEQYVLARKQMSHPNTAASVPSSGAHCLDCAAPTTSATPAVSRFGPLRGFARYRLSRNRHNAPPTSWPARQTGPTSPYAGSLGTSPRST